MDQPPIDNETEFIAHPQLLMDKDGEKLVTIVKATWELVDPSAGLELASEERMRPLWFADVPWGKPEIASIAYPADVCLRKPGTDVIVVGTAHAPDAAPTPSFDVLVRVGALSKALKIFGLRVWEKGGSGLSEARPLTQLDLKYDLAWGGLDDTDPERVVEESRNPVGMGCVRDGNQLTHQAAPQIEDPAFPIKHFKTAPPPAGVGAIGRNYEPRRQYAGTYDEAWQELRAPLLPADFDDRFNSCASPGLCSPVPLRGGESVQLLNLLPGGGVTSFNLPRAALEIDFEVDGREPLTVRPMLDTVLIDVLAVSPDKPLAVEMVWRAHTLAPRRMKDSRVIVREAAPGV
ncbi:MAG: DUF2169 domain-containing protein [Polyangiaceae bacterium]|nr:DUF2169 domain-containing protein [Polyangiaceae bacterium]MCW5789228.1 DUF2169 domain-containing protein [Polyangiaceae bacterium]